MEQNLDRNTLKSGFTLVELAIVIVIIGLLVGGVLQGQELIKQAKMRRVMSDMNSYRAGITTFYGKYNCLPGDCPNAFVVMGGQCGTNQAITTGGTGCNGNGDRTLSRNEGLHLWAQLTISKIIKGSYSVATNIIDGLPTTPFEGLVMATYSMGDPVSSNSCGFRLCDDSTLGGMRGNVLIAGQYNMSGLATTRYTTGLFFTGEDMLLFDIKFDDGKYFMGSISGSQMTILNPSGGGIFNSACGDSSTGEYYPPSTINGLLIRCPAVFALDL